MARRLASRRVSDLWTKRTWWRRMERGFSVVRRMDARGGIHSVTSISTAKETKARRTCAWAEGKRRSP